MIQKLQGKDHYKDRLYIHWDLHTKCNLNCEYCYARRFYNPLKKWSKLPNLNTQKHIIKSISFSSLPVFLGLQGGEPTLDPNLLELVDLIDSEILEKHDKNRLYITSNLKEPETLFKIPANKKIFILGSFHPRDTYITDFLDSILKLQESFKVRVNLMLIDEPGLYKKLHNAYECLINTKAEIHPHFVYEDHSRGSLALYSSKFYEEFKYMKTQRDFEIEETFGDSTMVETSEISDFELFEHNKHHFYGFHCYNNNYEIDFEGNVKVLCKSTKDSLLKNPLYFKNIAKIEPMICPHQNCNCDGLLKVLKVKNSNGILK